MIPSHDPEINLAFLAAMIDHFKRFLTSDDLVRQLIMPVAGRNVRSTMSLGLVLQLIDALERERTALPPRLRGELSDLVGRFEAIRDRHAVAYGDRLRRELKSHLDSWHWFLEACERGEESCFEDYRSEVWIRTRIHQLLAHGGDLGLDLDEAEHRLAVLDAKLRAVFRSGDYSGTRGDEATHPREVYWWLYGHPVRTPGAR